jgi:hypothetical protein
MDAMETSSRRSADHLCSHVLGNTTGNLFIICMLHKHRSGTCPVQNGFEMPPFKNEGGWSFWQLSQSTIISELEGPRTLVQTLFYTAEQIG